MTAGDWFLLILLAGVVGLVWLNWDAIKLRAEAMSVGKMQCPQCKSFIPADAVKCRHCGSTIA